jgi:hypothetical protein
MDFDPKELGLTAVDSEPTQSSTEDFDPKALGLKPVESDSKSFDPKALGLEPVENSSAFGAGARAAAMQAIPTIGSIPAMAAGAEIGAALTGPFAPLGAIVGGLAGAYGGGELAGKAQDWVMKNVLPDHVYQDIQNQSAQDQKEHPVATWIGEHAPMLAAFKPNISNVGDAISFAKDLVTNPKNAIAAIKAGDEVAMTKLSNLIGVTAGAGVGSAPDVANAIQDPSTANLLKAAAGFGLGGLINEPNRVGNALSFHNTIGKTIEGAINVAANNAGVNQSLEALKETAPNESQQTQPEMAQNGELQNEAQAQPQGEEVNQSPVEPRGLEGEGVEIPHGPGGGPSEELATQRSLEAADMFHETAKSGESPSLDQFTSDYIEQHPELAPSTPEELDKAYENAMRDVPSDQQPDKDTWQLQRAQDEADYAAKTVGDLYDQAQAAHLAYEMAGGNRSLADIVSQMNEPNTPENLYLQKMRDAGTMKQFEFTNAARDEAQREMGNAARELPAREGREVAWDSAKRRSLDDPTWPTRLVEELEKSPRVINSEEEAALQQHIIKLETARDLQIDKANRAHDAIAKMEAAGLDSTPAKEALQAAQSNLAPLLDHLARVDAIRAKTGTENARALAYRQNAAKQDYTLTRMLSRERESVGSRSLTPEETKHTIDLNKRIQDLEKRIDDLNKLNAVPKDSEGANKTVEALEKIKIDIDSKLKNKPIASEEKRLQSLKDRTQKRIDYLKDKIDRNDFTREAKAEPPKLDQEALDLMAEKKKLQQQFEQGIEKNRLASRKIVGKGFDLTTKIRRAMVLSSLSIVKKLAAYNLIRLGGSSVEEGVGGLLSKIPGISKIAAQSPREGFLNTKAISTGYKRAFMDSIKEGKSSLKTGQNSIDLAYGSINKNSPEWLDYVGHLHAALHTPAKLQEFGLSYEKRMTHALANGVDVNDPVVQTKIGMDAYRDSQRAAFLQNNRFADGLRALAGRWAAKDTRTGKPSTLGQFGKLVLEAELPIVKVPANVLSEGFAHIFGLPAGVFKTIFAEANLHPDEADQIMRLLKKGSIGSVMMILGALAPAAFGGLYQRGEKRGKDEAKAGELMIVGHRIPQSYVHYPALEAAQFAATATRLAQSKISKKDPEQQGIGMGIGRALIGMGATAPGIEQIGQWASAATNPREQSNLVGEQTKSFLIPGLISDYAKNGLFGLGGDYDEEGNPISRKTTTVGDYLKSGIPGLRETLPEKK